MRSALTRPCLRGIVPLAPLLAACSTPAVVPAPSPVLEIVARVGEPGEPASWSAHLGRPEGPAAPAAGRCAPRTATPGPIPALDRVSVTRPAPAALALAPAGRGWLTEGPRTVADPSWAVGDLHLVVGGEELVGEGLIRFGGAPRVFPATRGAEGEVQLLWDAKTVDTVEVAVVGPAGELRCGADDGGARLPWWAVPPDRGDVVLRTSREQELTLPDGSMLKVRATLERPIPLDEPGVQAAEPAPLSSPAPRARGPRHSSRPPRPIFG